MPVFKHAARGLLRDRGFALTASLTLAVARNLRGAADPIGQRVRMGSEGPALTVVGVVPDTRYRDLRTARPSVYFPLRQSFFPFAPLTLAVRATGDPAALVPWLRHAIARVDPGLRLASACTFDRHLERPLEGPRLNALLLGVFATASLALAGIGLFGVMATMVRQKTREIGVRMALGATRTNVFGAVMRRGLAIALLGATLGLLASTAGNRLLVALLYDVAPTDMATGLAVLGLLLAVSAAAVAVPARASQHPRGAGACAARGMTGARRRRGCCSLTDQLQAVAVRRPT